MHDDLHRGVAGRGVAPGHDPLYVREKAVYAAHGDAGLMANMNEAARALAQGLARQPEVGGGGDVGTHGGVVGEVVSFAVAHGHGHGALGAIAGGEAGLGVGHLKLDRLADIFERCVAQQGAGQQPAFAQDLEAVADAEHGQPTRSRADDLAHHRREARDGAATQVVAVGEAAGQDDQVEVIRQGRFLVPDHLDAGSGRALDGDLAITVAVGPREDDDSGFHGAGS